MGARASAAVAATGQWTDPDGVRRPAGDVHGGDPGTDQTLCGLPLSRSVVRLHVGWPDVQPESGRHADEVRPVRP